MEINKKGLIIIIGLIGLFIIGAIKVYQNHVDRLYLVLNNEIKESAKKCFLEKNCEGEITLGDLTSKGYVGVLVDPVTKEEVSKNKCLKYENNDVVFCN